MFLVELLACFCEEGTPRIARLLGAALAYRAGKTIVPQNDGPDRPVALVIKEEAHAIKGSAANLRLLRLTKVSLPAGVAFIAPPPIRFSSTSTAPPAPPMRPTRRRPRTRSCRARSCSSKTQERRRTAP